MGCETIHISFELRLWNLHFELLSFQYLFFFCRSNIWLYMITTRVCQECNIYRLVAYQVWIGELAFPENNRPILSDFLNYDCTWCTNLSMGLKCVSGVQRFYVIYGHMVFWMIRKDNYTASTKLLLFYQYM
jgi:hypothetical protein